MALGNLPALLDHRCHISAISLLEIQVGIRRVKPKDTPFAAKLEDWYRTRLPPGFDQRILPVDRAVAEEAVSLPVSRTLPPYDAPIAGTAQVHGLTIAARNVTDFTDVGVNTVNPWGTRYQSERERSQAPLLDLPPSWVE